MILEDHQKHQPAEGGKVSERWVGKLSKRCVQPGGSTNGGDQKSLGPVIISGNS